jgi:DNA-binding CsgD family transcriptional regulator
LAQLGSVTGDRAEATEALSSAAALFEPCGAVWRRQEALGLLAALGRQGRRAADQAQGAGALSVREREVARLAAGGLSARQIGERLFIGERTVENHLGRVYAKLAVSGRVELARRARELGLDT